MSIEFYSLSTPFPGKTSAGALGLSQSVLLRSGTETMVCDTGEHGVARNVSDALAELHIEPCSIQKVFLTHLHYDHVNNLAMYPNAVVYVGLREWSCANENRDILSPLETLLYLKEHRTVRFIETEGEEIFPGAKVIFTPGHTPGHCSLVFSADGRRIVFAGDAAKNRFELASETADMTIDSDISAASIRKIKAQGDLIIPGHDVPLLFQNGHLTPTAQGSLTFRLPGDGRSPGREWICRL